MNTQTQHTPWTADAETFNGQLERLHIGRKGRSLTLCIERESDLTNEEQEQAMHHVHHAINSHASLVAENKRLREALEKLELASRADYCLAYCGPQDFTPEQREVMRMASANASMNARAALNPEGTA